MCLEAIPQHAATVVCTACGREVHPHCMVMFTDLPACAICVQKQDRRQAYNRGIGRTV